MTTIYSKAGTDAAISGAVAATNAATVAVAPTGGITATNVQAALEKLDAEVSALTPQAFGAKGDGVTDDTAALQSWLDSAPAAGGILRLPVGKYLVAGGLTCSAPVQIVGAGTGTYETTSGGARIVCASTTASVLTLSAPGSVVSGVTFENTAAIGTNTAGAALLCTDFDWGRIERCMFIGFWNQLQVDSGYFYSVRDSAFLRPVNYGAYMRNTALGQFDHGDQVLEGCNFSRYGDPSRGAGGSGAGTAIRWESGGGLRLIGCKANAGTQPGYTSTGFWNTCVDVLIQSGATSVLVVSGCSWEGFYTSGVRIKGAAGSTFGKCAIVGNEFLASGSAGAVIDVNGSGMTNLGAIVVSSNVMYGASPGIVLKNLKQAVVVGNECGGLTWNPWLVLDNVERIRISGNNGESRTVDTDALDSTSSVGQSRDPWTYTKDVVGLTGSAQPFGGVTPGLYSNGSYVIRVRGNVQGVGGFYLEQRRHISRAAGAAVVAATIGTDLALGPAASEVALTWDVATSPWLIPRLTSATGKVVFGAVDVVASGSVYSLSYANPA